MVVNGEEFALGYFIPWATRRRGRYVFKDCGYVRAQLQGVKVSV